jgi:tetratricopeptide (TPR) repeat protein
MLQTDVPLRLAENEAEPDFVIPENPVIAERILFRRDHSLMEAFQLLSRAIAPHVNRKAIMRRSPESRLAGRLFDFDTVVKPLLEEQAEEFYLSVQKQWEWNSRYWEQRALLIADRDLDTALRYARHAVAIEEHPFPLTTLSKLILKSMEIRENRDRAYGEAFDYLTKAIEIEARRQRIRVHPFATLLSGTARYLELGGELSLEQGGRIDSYAEEAETRFANDPAIGAALRRLYDDE